MEQQLTREEMIEANLSLAKSIANKRWRRSRHLRLDFEDFLGWASIGLIHAVDNYDPKNNNTFGVYAYHCIQCQIHTGLESVLQVKRYNPVVKQQSTAFYKSIKPIGNQMPAYSDHGWKKVDNLDEIDNALSVLHPRDQEFLRMLFLDGKTDIEVGERFGISRQRVIQIRDRALRRLQKKMKTV